MDRWWLNDRLILRLFLGILLIVVGIVAYMHYEKTQKLSRSGSQTRTAFLRWRTQILGDETPGKGAMPGFKKGDNVYRFYPYPNPPIMALILWPFAELRASAGAMTWFALKLVMAVFIVVWAMRLCQEPGAPPAPAWVWILATLCSLHPILGDLSHGNVNIFIAFVVLGGLELYRRGWSTLAGLTIALAIASKITPALFVPYFGWKWAVEIWAALRNRSSWRQALMGGPPRLLLGCAAGLGIWWFAVPGAIFGWDHNLKLLGSWYEVMAKPFLIEGKITSEHANQSIPGLVVRLLTDSPSDIGFDSEDKPYTLASHNVLNISPEAVRGIVRACQAAWVLAVVGLCWSRQRQGLKTAAEVGLVMLGMLLFSERTWKHHAVVLAVPFAVFASFLAAYWHDRVLRNLAIGWLAAILGLMFIPSIVGEDFQDLALTYGTHTAAFLLLTLAMCRVLAHRDEASGTETAARTESDFRP